MTKKITWVILWVLSIGVTIFVSYSVWGGNYRLYTPEERHLDSSLKVYLDASQTKEWNLSNKPVLENLDWIQTETGEQYTSLEVYIENVGNIPIEVNVDTSQEDYISPWNTKLPLYATVGYSAYSDSIILESQGCHSIAIRVNLTAGAFLIYPADSDYWRNLELYFHICAEGNGAVIKLPVQLFE